MTTLPPFAHYLRLLPPGVLYERFRHELGLKRRVFSASVVRDLVNLLNDPGRLQEQMDELDPHTLYLALVLYAALPRPVAFPLDADESRKLVDGFLALPSRCEEGKTWLCGFRGRGESVLEMLVRTLVAKGEGETHGADAWAGGHPSNDLVLIIVLAGRGELARTATGALKRGVAARLHKMMSFGERGWRGWCPAGVDCVLGWARERGYLQESGKQYHLGHAFGAAVDRGGVWLLNDFEQYCREYLNWWDWDRFAHAAGSRWFRLTSFPLSLHDEVRSSLIVAQLCGRVRIRQHSGEITFQVRGVVPHEPAGAALTLLPDFSVLLAPHTPCREFAQFVRMGTVESFDRIYRGCLTRESLCTALGGGLNETEVFGALTRWRAPANVMATVKEWVREFNRVSLATSPLLLIGDSATGEHVQQCRQLRELIEPVTVRAVYRIRAGCLPRLEELLALQGYDTRFPYRDDSQGAPARGLERAGHAVFEPMYDLDDVSPPSPREITGGKYGSGLVRRDRGDIDNIIDYAVLMGLGVRFEYAGSSGIKKGVYVVSPRLRSRGAEPAVEGKDRNTGADKRFLLERILKIGVVEL